jgi:hypothetical protein
MSTAAPQLSPQDFAAKIRAKYPGAYDSLSDSDLTAKVVAKHPEYQSVVAMPSAATQTPDSGDAPIAGAYKQAGKSLVGGVGDAVKSLLGMPGQIYHAFSDAPQNADEQKDMTLGGPGAVGIKRLFIDPQVSEYNKAKQEAQQGNTSESMGHSIAAGVPVLGPLAAHIGEVGGKDPARALGEGLTYLAAPKVADTALDAVPKIAPVAKAMFQNDLAATSHDILNKGAVDVKSKLWDAHNQVSKRVGQLKNDIASADYQAGPPSIPTADLQSKVLDLSDKYRASDSNTPAFSTAAKRVAELPANLSFKDLADLKSEVGTKWSKTPDGTPDSAAINELRSTIDQKLANRATELDRTKQYGAFNKLWSTLMGYESDGAMGKLLNADNGAKFMDVLKDPANKAEIARTVDSLQNFGLDPDTLKNFQQSHEPLHNFVNQNGMNRLKLVLQNPTTSLPGMIAGGAIGAATGIPGGAYLGGTGGALAGARLPARFGAARAVADLGAPSLTGEMSEAAQVKPVGNGEPPPRPQTPSNLKPPDGGNSTGGIAQQAIRDAMNKPRAPEYGGESQPAPKATVNAVDPKEVTEFAQALGYKKADAIARAKEAIAANPYDLKAAQDYVAGKRTDKAAQIQNIKTNGSSESAASQEAINRTASEKAQSIQRIRIDTRSGKETPLIGVDAVDATPGPYDVIVKRSPSGEQVLDRGAKARGRK